MNAYKKSWLVVCALLAVLGASVAFVRSPLSLAVLFMLCGALGVLLTLGFVVEHGERASRGRIRPALGGGLVGGGAAASFIGFASLLGPGVLLLAVAISASSPYAVRTYRRHLGVASWSACWATLAGLCVYPLPRDTSRPRMALSALTDDQLCRRWRASYVALMRPSAGQMEEIVIERQNYLDEFERRNRSEFAAWLASGPMASASPMPYQVDVAPVDWDDLIREEGQ